MSHLPISTLRDIAVVAVFVADAAWEGAKRALSRLRPHLEPPGDLEVRSAIGAIYSGVILIDHNEVIAGIITRSGAMPPPIPERTSSLRSSTLGSPWSSATSPIVTPPHGIRGRDDDYDDCRLPSWAEDSRDREDDRWRR